MYQRHTHAEKEKNLLAEARYPFGCINLYPSDLLKLICVCVTFRVCRVSLCTSTYCLFLYLAGPFADGPSIRGAEQLRSAFRNNRQHIVLRNCSLATISIPLCLARFKAWECTDCPVVARANYVCGQLYIDNDVCA